MLWEEDKDKGNMASYVINKDSKPLSRMKYSVDKRNRVFMTQEENIELDFSKFDYWTFIVDSHATIKAGKNCIFRADYHCIFNTGGDCTFDTHGDCTFDTGEGCVFRTRDDNCTFNTGNGCTFKTRGHNKFETGSQCTFYATWHNEFKTGRDCTFLIFQIKFQKFDAEKASGSIIYDGNPNNRYVLNEDLIRLIKILPDP